MHESLGVMLDKGGTSGIGLNLKNLPTTIQSVIIFFSIYDEGNRLENNFSVLPSPEVIVLADEKVFCKFLIKFGEVKIFKAIEIY